MKSAVLFLIFKRPETTTRVFERIREARPPKLYIAADGPRLDRPDEKDKCIETRKIVENIDWPCEVSRLYRDVNMGCGKGVSSAISWFFENEEQGIIIEDDILPHIDFFRYCDEMLDRYKDDTRIQLVAGWNPFYGGYHSDVSYYLTNFGSIWGWASWRRVWSTYHFDVNDYSKDVLINNIKKRLPPRTASYYVDIYKTIKKHKIDTWDYQLIINRFYYDRYGITPYINMIENIGMGGTDSTHTTNENPEITNHKSFSPYPIVHPDPIDFDHDADMMTIRNTKVYNRPIIFRIIGKIKRLIMNK